MPPNLLPREHYYKCFERAYTREGLGSQGIRNPFFGALQRFASARIPERYKEPFDEGNP
jgi:hypothetical protein